MATDQSDELLILKQQLLEKDQILQQLREEKDLLEENLDEQEATTKDVRQTLQKRVDDLRNEIDDKDEQLDSLNEEIVSLKNNNKIQEVGGTSSQESDSLKEQLQKNIETVSEMKEKLNKGGMTINNLHMEIRELKEDLSTANDSGSTKSEKIKEMREENAKIKSTMKELQTKLDFACKDSDSAQISDGPVNTVQLEVLRKEMGRKNEELMSTRIELEKCQKQLNAYNKNSIQTEKTEHSRPDTYDSIVEELKTEKSKNSNLEQKLAKTQSDFQKAIVGLAVLIIAFLVSKVLF